MPTENRLSAGMDLAVKETNALGHGGGHTKRRFAGEGQKTNPHPFLATETRNAQNA